MSPVPSPASRRACALALSLFLTAGMSTATVAATAGSASAQQVAVQKLRATLSPAGDSDGSGKATIRLNRAKRTVCATATWTNIATPDAAHIHRRSDGGVVVDLSGSVTGGSKCATVPRRTIKQILRRPGRYYFNIHNPEYPAGAIEGRLRR